MKIGSLPVEPALGVAPMAGMTDTAFRRLVKRHGGCGLVVSEMVSSEGLVRGIDRTLEYAEYTEEERPVSIQIFGGDPAKMADAAQIVEGMGADVVDVNMGCPVPKIAKHNAGCSLMREPAHAAGDRRRDGQGGEDSGHGEDARRLDRRRDQRAAARAAGRGRRRGGGHRARPHRRSRPTPASSDWDADRPRRRASCRFRSSAAATASSPSRSSSACGRPAWPACSSAAACCAIRGFSRRRPICSPAGRCARVSHDERGALPARLHRPAAAASASTRRSASATARRWRPRKRSAPGASRRRAASAG